MSNEERPQIKWEWARKSKWATAMAMGMGIGMGIKFSHVPVVDYVSACMEYTRPVKQSSHFAIKGDNGLLR